MKCTILLAIAFATFATVQSIDRKRPPLINRPNVWDGTPYVSPPDLPFDRVRRSPKEPATGKIVVQGGARKGSSTGGKTEGQIYVGGQIRFRREAGEETENVNLPDIHGAPEPASELPLDRVARSPKKGKGRVILRGEAGSGRGGKPDVAGHVMYEYRFKRDADQEEEVNKPDVHGAPVSASDLPLDRVARSPKKGKGRVILRGEAGTGRGGKPDVAGHVMYEYRFKRDADQEEEVNKPDVHGAPVSASDLPLDRVARSPKKGKGRVILRGEAGSGRGGKPDVAGHVMYEYRFKRDADQGEEVNKPDVHGAPVSASDLPLDRVARSPKKGKGRVILRGEAGSGRGGKPDVAGHVMYEYRFKRDADQGEEVNKPDVHGAPVPASDLPLDRVARSPKKGKGRVILRGEAGSGRGGKPDVAGHVMYEYRFKRDADQGEEVNKPDVHGAPVLASDVPFEHRARRSPKKGKGRVILRGEAGTGRGGKPDVAGHVMYEYRFRRSAEQEDEVNKPDVHGAPVLAGDVPFEYSYQGEVNRPDIYGAPEELKDILTRTEAGELAANDIVSEEKDPLDLLGHPLIRGYSPAEQLEKAEESGQ